MAQALEWLVAHIIPVINMSLAVTRNAVLDRLIEQAVTREHMVVAAPPAYPPMEMARFTGTSFATAHVAASLARCRADGHTAPQCLDALIKSARDLGAPGCDTTHGYDFVE